MKTAQELINHCKSVTSWKYVYGCKGEILTREKYNQLKKQYGSMVWDSDINKLGYMCCDCSGLISSCTGILRGSYNYKETAVEVLPVSALNENWNNYVGWAIWMKGHIGVVSDTKGYYYAMDGSDRNWVHNPLNKQNWTHILKLKDIEYPMNGWVKSDTKWYFYEGGETAKNDWIKDDNKWYHLSSTGVMDTNTWIHNNSGTWSYVDAQGAAVTGWAELEWDCKINWYYFDEEGTMLRDTWIDDYYVGHSGELIKDSWIPWMGRYYWVGHKGKWMDKEGWTSYVKPEDGYYIYE